MLLIVYDILLLDLIYIHFLKNREGQVKILKFINDLKYNNLKEPEAENPTE